MKKGVVSKLPAMEWMTGLDSTQRQGIFLSPPIHIGPEIRPVSYLIGSAISLLSIKQPECEAKDPPASRADVEKNGD
jgi:hypothetical protein